VTGQALQASTSHYRGSGGGRRNVETDEDEDGLDVVGMDDVTSHHHHHLLHHSPGNFTLSFNVTYLITYITHLVI